MFDVQSARAALLAVIRRYAPPVPEVTQEGLQAISAAMEDLEAAAVSTAGVPGVTPPLPVGAEPQPRDPVQFAEELAAHPEAYEIIDMAQMMNLQKGAAVGVDTGTAASAQGVDANGSPVPAELSNEVAAGDTSVSAPTPAGSPNKGSDSPTHADLVRPA